MMPISSNPEGILDVINIFKSLLHVVYWVVKIWHPNQYFSCKQILFLTPTCILIYEFLLELLFVWVYFVPLENFSLIWRCKHYRWRATNFHVCTALMTVEQWSFFNVPHLLWQGPTLYNGNLPGPVTLPFVAERLAVEQWSCQYLF